MGKGDNGKRYKWEKVKWETGKETLFKREYVTFAPVSNVHVLVSVSASVYWRFWAVAF
jgi:hypothetical protein